MTIIFIGIPNTPGMTMPRHNALRNRRISEDNLRCAGKVCLDDTQNGLRDGKKA
jgi:hypothetical protein